MELAYHKGPVKFQTEWAHAVYDARHPAHDTVVGGGIDAVLSTYLQHNR